MAEAWCLWFVPWTKWSLCSSKNWIIRATWRWLYYIPLSKEETLHCFNHWEPKRHHILRVCFYLFICFSKTKGDKNQTVLHMWSWHYWLTNTKCWVQVFSLYLFIIVHPEMDCILTLMNDLLNLRRVVHHSLHYFREEVYGDCTHI